MILITGGNGQLGTELRHLLDERGMAYTATDAKELDITDGVAVDKFFDENKPELVYHCAAYTAVDKAEDEGRELDEKINVDGTKNVAECADKYRVERMVLISTDKAVNPTNLMGASKRACELVIQHMNKVAKHTKYMAVRFGNVLGSNGSVIPIFRKLLEEGKNLTLTHKDITRYFMTIPEAAQLVIEAGSLGNGGEIFILDMGKPVKIYDLAQTMIKLSNSNVGIDIVGLRPGEKLFEELLYDINSAIKTENKKIFITKIEDGEVDITQFFERLWEAGQHANIDEIKDIMKKLVVSYKEVSYL